ncbi:MAG: metallophosphoesterase [Campylobacteraceae bacterium]|nr:metallophosphoesterase [Campylobacteraceae bacterium]
MLFITGDTHGGYHHDVKKLMSFKAKSGNLTKDDYLIIAGDFGFIWYKGENQHELKWMRFFNNLKCTTLFVDGNHENFDRLNKFEVSKFKGGKVHQISDSVYHLMRGEVFELDGRKVFTMGGALSIDKDSRVPGKSWWEDEAIKTSDMQNAWQNLAKHDNKVDIIVTHTCPNSIMSSVELFGSKKFNDISSFYLDEIYKKVEFKKWYFGHFHQDIIISDKFRAVYNDIVQI